MTPPIKKWTPNDEVQLQRMIKAKEEFEAAVKAPLSNVVWSVRDFLLARGDWTHGDMMRAMINNADELRDALAPFDSGIRVEPSDSTTR